MNSPLGTKGWISSSRIALVQPSTSWRRGAQPLVDTLAGSKLANLKELRVHRDGHLRILFVFDPRRTAILLLGGDKTRQWAEWYRWAIPEAERLYDMYLEELRREGLLP